MKKILIILLLLILTGCTAKFNVKIEDEKIIQNISMNGNIVTEKKKLFDDVIEDIVVDVENDTEYLGYFQLKNITEKGLNAFKSYDLSRYYRDYALYYCYDSQEISYENNILKIETSNYFNCFDKYSMIDNVNINVTTGYKVLENNADIVNGHTYTWNITKTNRKGIKLVLDTTLDEIEQEKENKIKKDKNISLIMLGTLILFIFGTVIFVYIKSKQNNKI